MKRLIFVVFFMLSCGITSWSGEEIYRYNIFGFLRGDKDTQSVYVSKLTLVEDTTFYVDVDVSITDGSDTFSLKRMDSERFEGYFSVEPLKTYTLLLDGELGKLQVSCTLPSLIELLAPEPMDTIKDTLKITLVKNKDIYTIFAKCEGYKGQYFYMDEYEMDTVELEMVLEPDTANSEETILAQGDIYFSVIGYDSLTEERLNEFHHFSESYDTLPDYFGILMGSVGKRIKVYKAK